MDITKDQIRFLQTSFSREGMDRDARLEYLSNFFGYPIHSTKDLTKIQAQELIHFRNTGEVKPKRSWGFFDKQNTQHMKILNLMHDLDWMTNFRGKYVPDLEALGGWLQSKRAPVRKPISQMDPEELTKTIHALTGVLKSSY